MEEQNDEVLKVLVEIRDTLNRIYTCFEDQYLEIEKQIYQKKVKILEAILTPDRRKIFPLLFDKKPLSQTEIADAVGVTQSAVSKFVSKLIENDIIEQVTEDGNNIYRDKYDLLKSV